MTASKGYKNYQVGYGPRKKKVLETRKCMCCQKDFKSEGPHNRICLPCKSTQAWKDGNDTGACGLSQASKARSD